MLTKLMKMSLLRCLFLTVCVNLTAASDYVYGDEQTPAFKDYEMFQDIFPLTESNFTEVVLRRSDPWVITFHTGMLDRTWKTMAVAMRGVIWVGMIDVNNNQQLLQNIDYDPKADTDARVYLYGNEKSKKKSWRRVADADTARSAAVKSLPDMTVSMTVGEIEEFVVDSFMAKPSRFPAIFVTDEKKASALMKAVSLRFHKYFHFGILTQPSVKDLGKLGMHRLYGDKPGLLILAATESGNLASPQFNAIPFDKNTMGEFNYPNLLAFLFSVNREFRHLLPGDNLSNEREAVEMEELLEMEALRFDVKGLIGTRKEPSVKYMEAGEGVLDKKEATGDIEFEATVSGTRMSDEL